MTNEATRRPEPRTCAQCGYRIVNPYIKRCPRCLAGLPAIAMLCGSCAQGCATTVSCATEAPGATPGPGTDNKVRR